MELIYGIIVKPGVVLLCAMLLSFIMRRNSASLRHSLWAAAILGAALLPLAPNWEFPMPGGNSSMIVQYSSVETPAQIVSAVRPAAAEADESAATNAGRPITARDFVVLAWLAGSLIVCMRFLFGIRAARRLVGRSVVTADPGWLFLLKQLRGEFRIKQTVSLVFSGEGFSPMTSGLFRSVIVLPAAAADWSAERRRLVLAHELAHVKRGDPFVQLALQLAVAVYWFNPLFWYAARILRADRERACDDHVLRLGTDPYLYATELLEVARAVSANGILSLATISMANSSQLESRLSAIMDPQRKRRIPSGKTSMLVCGTFAVLILLVTAIHFTAMPSPVLHLAVPSLPQIQVLQPSSTAPRPWVYQKWLDEDVPYIIFDEERRAFEALKTDEEHERFIAQFWARRDPTPDTAGNEFKTEHYERIAYANTRFAFSQPGWKSDRGRIYIQHGKPDALDSHPAGSANATYPYEVWTYRYMQDRGTNVVFEFIDPGQNGEYGLRPPGAEAREARGSGASVSSAAAPNWAGVWTLNLVKSKLPTGFAAGLFERATMEFKDVPGGASVTFDIVSPPNPGSSFHPSQRMTTTLKNGAMVSRSAPLTLLNRDDSPPVLLPNLKSGAFRIVDGDSLEFRLEVVQYGAPVPNTVLLSVSPDRSFLRATSPQFPNLFVVFDKQQ